MHKYVDILVGGQFGSEGKGVAAPFIAHIEPYDVLVSVATAQAGHTAYLMKQAGYHKIVSRHLPSACLINQRAPIFLGPGVVVNLDVFLDEVKELEEKGIPIADRLYLSNQGAVIDEHFVHTVARSPEEHARRARRVGLTPEQYTEDKVNTTREGVSQALSMKAKRDVELKTFRGVKDTIVEALKKWGRPRFVDYANLVPGMDGRVFIEGSQGWGLSINSPYYPLVTSRDCSAAGFLSMAGIAPRHVRNIYGVYRTFPIRVAGLSGPFPSGETSWERVAQESGYPALQEITTVTKRVRRVGRWSDKFYMDSIDHNGITHPMLTFINYINNKDEGKERWADLTSESREFVDSIGGRTGKPIWVVSGSPHWENWIEVPLYNETRVDVVESLTVGE